MATDRADPINHPSHYTFSHIEVIDAIEAWELGFHLANVIKYVARADRKGRPLDDLKTSEVVPRSRNPAEGGPHPR